MWSRHIRMPAALALAMILPTAALAATTEEQIEHLKRENAQMKEMLMQMQEQLQNVMMKTNAMEQQAKAAAGGKGKKGMVSSKKENITISATGGGIKVKSDNGNQFKIGGRLMFDHDSYDEFWDEGDDKGGSGEENEIRRSRVTLAGQNGKHWSYKFTVNIDHEDEGATVDTGYLKYSSKPMYVKVGKYKRPAMLEERTSSKWMSTVEHSIVNELSGAVLGKPDFGGVEIGFATKGDLPMSGALGVYDDEIDEDDGSDVYGIGARFSIAPQLGDDSFLHAGASFYTADFKGENHRMRSRMGVHTAGRPFETNSMASDDIDQMGAEFAYVNGPFSFQSEFMNVESDGTDDAGCGSYAFVGDAGQEADAVDGYESGGDTCDLEMDGFYVQAAYTLTGETRGYKAASGEFKAIKPKDEMGAWELVARYEDADIDVPGRSLDAELERLVLGVNWYVNKNVKLMLNYVDAEADCSGSTVKATDGSNDSGTDANALLSKDWKIKRCGYNNEDSGGAVTLRAQYVF